MLPTRILCFPKGMSHLGNELKLYAILYGVSTKSRPGRYIIFSIFILIVFEKIVIKILFLSK